MDEVGTQQVLMTSVTVPLLDQGSLLGMVGSTSPWGPCRPGGRDGPDPLQGQGKVLLLSSEGRVAGVEGFPVALGNLLEQQKAGRISRGG